MTVTDSNFDAAKWRKQLDALPTGGRIPSFFFAHGCTFSFSIYYFVCAGGVK